jgi:hypothetical protein
MLLVRKGPGASLRYVLELDPENEPASVAPILLDRERPTNCPAIPPLQVFSSAFDPGGEIPVQYSCHGADLSQPLEWSGVPEGSQSLAW